MLRRFGGAARRGVEALGGVTRGDEARGVDERGAETFGTLTVGRVGAERISRRGATRLLGRGDGTLMRSERDVTGDLSKSGLFSLRCERLGTARMTVLV